MARKKVIDLDTYSQLDQWAISLHEMYRALRRAGFAVDICLAIISDRDAYPDWICHRSLTEWIAYLMRMTTRIR
jgi:hypothetical protein